jgi:O-6-methylguanine DNA methyltransferase
VAVTDHGLCEISTTRTWSAKRNSSPATRGARPAFAEADGRGRRQLDNTSPASGGTSTWPSTFARRATSAGRCSRAARVPYGELTTYGTLAARRPPRAARAVGTVMNRNPVPIVLPCHRVVGSTGSLVGYGGGPTASAHCQLEGASTRLTPEQVGARTGAHPSEEADNEEARTGAPGPRPWPRAGYGGRADASLCRRRSPR